MRGGANAKNAAEPMPMVRVAAKEDAAILAELGRVTFEQTFAAQNKPEDRAAYVETYFSACQLAHELTDTSATFLVAEVSGNPVGYAKIWRGEPDASVTGENPVELARLYVLAEWHGHKVGAALMAECIQQAKRGGFQTLWLGVWERSERAIRFYQKWGFERVGSHIFLLGSDAQTDFILQKELF